MEITETTNVNSQIKRIQIVKVSDVDLISAGSSSRTKTITLKNGGQFVDIPFTMGSALFHEDGKKSNQGILFNQEVTFQMAGTNENNDEVLLILERSPFIALITWTDEKKKIIGSQDNWVQLNRIEKADVNRDNDLSITCNSINRAYDYEE